MRYGCRLSAVGYRETLARLGKTDLHLKRRFERDRAKLTAAVMNQK